MDLSVVVITPENVGAACRLAVQPAQQGVVAPVAESLAEAYAQPDVAWPRLLLDGDDPVAFVMAGFDPASDLDFFRCGIWRLLVGAEHQGRGYGRAAVQVVIDEAVRRGEERVTVLWKTHQHGPEDFYLKLGFRPTGQVFCGETVGELSLSRS